MAAEQRRKDARKTRVSVEASPTLFSFASGKQRSVREKLAVYFQHGQTMLATSPHSGKMEAETISSAVL